MRAAIYNGIHDVTVEELPKPELVPGSVIVKNIRSGICGTDLYAFNISGKSVWA